MRVFTGFALMALVYASAFAAEPESAAPKADLERGKQIGSSVCAACHGADGNSTMSANPILAGQNAGYIAAQLKAFKSGTRQSPIMQGMAAGLSDEDMVNVGAYFQSQKPANANKAADKAGVARAQKIWRAGIKAAGVPACAGCHGAAGHGIPAQYPRVAGQHAELTLGWLKAYANGTRSHPAMSMVAQRLSEPDMKVLSDYMAGLR